MSSNTRQLLTGAAALLAALVLTVALRTGISLAQTPMPSMPDASGSPAVLAGTMESGAGMQASMPVTAAATCSGGGKMCGGVVSQGRMGQPSMMGHGMMGREMMNGGMMRHRMAHQGGRANVTGTMATVTDTLEAVSTGSAQATVPESFAAALAEADAKRGQQLTLSNGCIGCHSLDASMRMVGPTWHGLAETAAGRVAGQAAAEYLYSSIVRPNAYVAPGYPPSVMIQSYGQQLGEHELADIVKYLLTLKD